MKKTYCIIMTALFVILAGCAATGGRVETDFGTSHRLAIANQTLNPEAGKNLAPVIGLNGVVAQKVNERYLKTFDKTEPAPRYLLSIGTSGDAPR